MVKAISVAEKPSVAKKLAELLSGGHANRRNGKDQYCANYDFSCTILGNQDVQMTMTSVMGHMMELEFVEGFRKWHDCAPLALFDAPVVKTVPDKMKNVAANLRSEARNCTILILWLDCDREGENIAREVVQCCRDARRSRSLRVYRARFSSLVPAEIQRAIRNLSQLDELQADAVDARQEIDLRLGAAFTRFQTTLLQHRFNTQNEGVISYGPCQFPCIGFVVERYQQIQAFVPRQFWFIKVSMNEPGAHGRVKADFMWERQRLFNRMACTLLFELCVTQPQAQVTKVSNRPKLMHRPFPLATLKMQQLAIRHLRMSGDQTMAVAEKLYQKGILSYPRTETDKFPSDFDLHKLIDQQTVSQQWGAYAQGLLDGKFKQPKAGKGDDKAHPPIHPTKFVAPERMDNDEKRLYELVVRYFLGCCSDDARGASSQLQITIAGEVFKTTGQTVLERNWLDVVRYERWNSRTIPCLSLGDVFIPSSLLMMDGATKPPELLSEDELIAIMDKNGIGTDATMAEHIKKIQERNYASKDSRMRFKPTDLGVALIDGYNSIGETEACLSKPYLRAHMEADCQAICDGNKTKAEVVTECLRDMKRVFENILVSKQSLETSMAARFGAAGDGPNIANVRGGVRSRCGDCNGQMREKKFTSNENNHILHCSHCKKSHALPHHKKFTPYDHECPLCKFQVLTATSTKNGSTTSFQFCPNCYNTLQPGESMACYKCSAIERCTLAGGTDEQEPITPCFTCKGQFVIKKGKQGKFFVACNHYPSCKTTLWLPKAVRFARTTDRICKPCATSNRHIRMLKVTCNRRQLMPGMPANFFACIRCDAHLTDLGMRKGLKPGCTHPQCNGAESNNTSMNESSNQSHVARRSGGRSLTHTQLMDSHETLIQELAGAASNSDSIQSRMLSRPAKRKITVGRRLTSDKTESGKRATHVCPGHQKPCVQRTVRKEGANQGRKFWVCSMPRAEQCRCFIWDDE